MQHFLTERSFSFIVRHSTSTFYFANMNCITLSIFTIFSFIHNHGMNRFLLGMPNFMILPNRECLVGTASGARLSNIATVFLLFPHYSSCSVIGQHGSATFAQISLHIYIHSEHTLFGHFGENFSVVCTENSLRVGRCIVHSMACLIQKVDAVKGAAPHEGWGV